MNSSNPLSRLRLASRLCIVGAWLSLAIGGILIILFYALNSGDNGPNSGPGLGIIIFGALLIALLSLFVFLVLYAVAAVLNYMGLSRNMHEEGTNPPNLPSQPEEDDAQLEITPIQKVR